MLGWRRLQRKSGYHRCAGCPESKKCCHVPVLHLVIFWRVCVSNLKGLCVHACVNIWFYYNTRNRNHFPGLLHSRMATSPSYKSHRRRVQKCSEGDEEENRVNCGCCKEVWGYNLWDMEDWTFYIMQEEETAGELTSSMKRKHGGKKWIWGRQKSGKYRCNMLLNSGRMTLELIAISNLTTDISSCSTLWLWTTPTCELT